MASDAGESPRPVSDRDTHLWDYVHVLLRRRAVVLAIFVVVVGLATTRTLLTRPVYQGTAQILIEKSDPNVLNFKGVTEQNAGWGIEDYYQTQYKLLQSRSLAQRVIEQQGLLDRSRVRRPPFSRGHRRDPGPPRRAVARHGDDDQHPPRAAQRPPRPQQPPRQRQRDLLSPRAGRQRHQRPRPHLHRAISRHALPDLVRRRPVARGPDRAAARPGRRGRPEAPRADRAGGPREHRGAPHAPRAAPRGARDAPSTSARPSGCRKRPSGARWLRLATPRSCPRSCEARSSSHCASSSPTSSVSRPSSSTATSSSTPRS